jgi:hypothetical protein
MSEIERVMTPFADSVSYLCELIEYLMKEFKV